ncbi:MFS general substrate transporter [Penicillium verhagenii]|nr:MFS general substrate transporter [Penicillium verhagenii]
MALNPLGADLIYTIANLVMTASFPTSTQAMAGGVFNMIAQIGKSVGIATSAVIARQVIAQAGKLGTKEALLLGYKAGVDIEDGSTDGHSEIDDTEQDWGSEDDSEDDSENSNFEQDQLKVNNFSKFDIETTK